MSWKDTYKVWQERTDLEPDLKQELAAMNDDKEIEDAFYGPLSFGTAGMRGLMGPGINRMNVYTVRQATEGLATLMDSLETILKNEELLLVTILGTTPVNLLMMLLVYWGLMGLRFTSMIIYAQRLNCHLQFVTWELMRGS